jgi:hypothetical protein
VRLEGAGMFSSVVGTIVAELMVIALVVDHRDRRGESERMGRMRLPRRLARLQEAKMMASPFTWRRARMANELPDQPKAG